MSVSTYVSVLDAAAATVNIGAVVVDTYTCQATVAIGDVAAGATDSGQPVKIGGYASTTPPSAVTAAQRANIWVDLNGRQQVGGQVAHGATIAGNPIHVGAEACSTDRTALTAGQAARLEADLLGKLVVSPYASSAQMVSGVTAAITGTGDTAVIAAQGSGVRIYVTSLTVANSHASTGTVVEIKDGSTVLYRVHSPALSNTNVVLPVPLRLTANTALNAANLTNASNTYVSACGFSAGI